MKQPLEPAPRRALADLVVDQAGAVAPANAEQDCLASAVYFEARGEPLEGQLAVAEVVLNRARSGRYPSTICAVVRQPAQFSFVRRGVIPRADPNCEHWRRASRSPASPRAARPGCCRRTCSGTTPITSRPSWGRRLARNTRIGAHIFYS